MVVGGGGKELKKSHICTIENLIQIARIEMPVIRFRVRSLSCKQNNCTRSKNLTSSSFPQEKLVFQLS